MKLIFLDIDGVLNHSVWMTKVYPVNPGRVITDQGAFWRAMEAMDPECVSHLNRVLRETGAKVVVSSSWRHGRTVADLKRILVDKNGLEADIIGLTPTDRNWVISRLNEKPHAHDALHIKYGSRLGTQVCRGDEIQAWLNANPTPDQFIIIDDDRDMAYLTDQLVQINNDTGFQSWHAEEALKRFRK